MKLEKCTVVCPQGHQQEAFVAIINKITYICKDRSGTNFIRVCPKCRGELKITKSQKEGKT